MRGGGEGGFSGGSLPHFNALLTAAPFLRSGKRPSVVTGRMVVPFFVLSALRAQCAGPTADVS